MENMKIVKKNSKLKTLTKTKKIIQNGKTHKHAGKMPTTCLELDPFFVVEIRCLEPRKGNPDKRQKKQNLKNGTGLGGISKPMKTTSLTSKVSSLSFKFKFAKFQIQSLKVECVSFTMVSTPARSVMQCSVSFSFVFQKNLAIS